MMIDSGADIDAISEEDWLTISNDVERGQTIIFDISAKPLFTPYPFASRKPLTIKTIFKTWASVESETSNRIFSTFFVIAGATRSLIGRQSSLELNILRLGPEVNAISTESHATKAFPSIPNFEAIYEIDPNVAPTKNAYYSVPAAYEEEATKRLEEMEKQDIIEKVYGAPKWISGMNAVSKDHSRDFRLVVNMRGPNRAIQRPFHRLPLIDHLKVDLHGAKIFTKLDLKSAFFHIVLAPESRELTTFMTSKGMYRYKRLNFGVNSAPEIFQKKMEEIFYSIPGVIIFIDDILVYATNATDLRTRTESVLAKIKENNLTLNTEKCEYERKEVTFLGHKLSEHGFSISEEKVKALKNFREPNSMPELRSFMGMASFLGAYIKDFGNLTAPLWAATKGKEFTKSEEFRSAFRNTIRAIEECTITQGFFSNEETTILYTDASPTALGSVLAQESNDGRIRVISFASKSLTDTERRYPQVQREALAIVWAVEHFHYYLLGREFIIRTDAQGVAFIFKRERETCRRLLTRADGWALRLSAFDYKLEFVKGRYNIADPPSRLYESNDEEYVEKGPAGAIICKRMDRHKITLNQSAEVNAATASPIRNLLAQSITIEQVERESAVDSTFIKAMRAITNNEWPLKAKMPVSNDFVKDEELQKLWKVRANLSVENGVLIKQGAVVLPQKLRSRALLLSHHGHPGSNATKSILRSRVWWPAMNEQIEHFVEACESCSRTSKSEKPVPMRRSILPTEPWEALAVDFSGPHSAINGGYVLLIVDYYSRYLVAFIVKRQEFEGNVKPAFERLFERFGKPKSVRSDNGPPFNGDPYASYLREAGVKAEFSIPLHPQQNGMIERYMQLVNKAAQISTIEGTAFEGNLNAILRAHNQSRHRITGQVPEDLLWGRKLRRELPALSSKLTISNEALRERDFQQKVRAKAHEDKRRGAHTANIVSGDTVRMLNTRKKKGDPKYSAEKFIAVALSGGDFLLVSEDGRGTCYKRNITHLKKVSPAETPVETTSRNNENRCGESATSNGTSEVEDKGTQGSGAGSRESQNDATDENSAGSHMAGAETEPIASSHDLTEAVTEEIMLAPCSPVRPRRNTRSNHQPVNERPVRLRKPPAALRDYIMMLEAIDKE